MILDQGNFPKEDFDQKFTNTWELLILLAIKDKYFLNFVLEFLSTEKWDIFVLYMDIGHLGNFIFFQRKKSLCS